MSKKDDRYTDEGAERCVCCGRAIPEGRMVCPICEKQYKNQQRNEWKSEKSNRKRSRQ